MKKGTYLLSTLMLASVVFAETSYDYIWNSSPTGENYDWNNAANWTDGSGAAVDTVPNAESNVFIITSLENGLDGSSSDVTTGNNINLGGDVTVKSVNWEVRSNVQKFYTGGTLYTESFTLVSSAEHYISGGGPSGGVQVCIGSELNVTNADGTGLLTIGAVTAKFNYIGADTIVNDRIVADNITLLTPNAWADSSDTKLSLGWGNAGTKDEAIITVNNTLTLGDKTEIDFTRDFRENSYLSAGGINGSGKIVGVKTEGRNFYITLTGVGEFLYGGIVSGNTNVIMDSSSTQIFSNSENSFASVTMIAGRGEFEGSLGNVVIEGGTISSYDVDSADTVMNMASLTWSGGAIDINILEDMSDTIAIAGDFTTSGDDKLTFDLDFDEFGMESFLEGKDDKSYTYDILSIGGISTIDNSNFVFDDNSDKFNYDFAVEDGIGKLTISLAQVPEPADIAVFFGAFALIFAAYRRK